MHQCTPTKLPGKLYNKHTCCNSMEAAQQDVFKSCSGPVNFIGDNVSRAGAEGHAEEGYRKKISAPATAMKGAANNTRQAYFIIPRVAGGTALLGAGGKKHQRSAAAACTCLRAPVHSPPPHSHHDDNQNHHNSLRAKQERGDTSLSAPASSPELLGIPARTSTLAHSIGSPKKPQPASESTDK